MKTRTTRRPGRVPDVSISDDMSQGVIARILGVNRRTYQRMLQGVRKVRDCEYDAIRRGVGPGAEKKLRELQKKSV